MPKHRKENYGNDTNMPYSINSNLKESYKVIQKIKALESEEDAYFFGLEYFRASVLDKIHKDSAIASLRAHLCQLNGEFIS